MADLDSDGDSNPVATNLATVSRRHMLGGLVTAGALTGAFSAPAIAKTTGGRDAIVVAPPRSDGRSLDAISTADCSNPSATSRLP